MSRRLSTSLVCLLLGWGLGASAFSISSARARANLGTRSLIPTKIMEGPSLLTSRRASPLFSSTSRSEQHPSLFRRILKHRASSLRASWSLSWLFTKFRRGILVFSTVFFLWLGTASLHTKPSVASTASAAASVERIMEKTSPSLDTIVDRYVQDHMFDDDTYDPVESTYREAYDDATRGAYPQALREVTSSIFGQEGVKSVSKEERSGIGLLLTTAISALQKRGLSESASVIVLAALFVLAGPSLFLFFGMIVGGMSKRNINRVMKQRYGDTYSVDATIKEPEEVEAPDDEDEDEDDVDDEEEDDEEDDE